MPRSRDKRRRDHQYDSSADESPKRYRKNRNERYQSERSVEVHTPPSCSRSTRNDSGKEDTVTRLERLVEKLVDNKQNELDVSRNHQANTRYVVKNDCIPEFTPGKPNASINKWLHKIEQLALIHNWDESLKTYYMQSRLSGLARSWYDNLPSYDYRWDEWKSMLIRAFPESNDFATSLRKLVDRVKSPNETMLQYYYCKMELLQTCKITGKDAVSCLIEGLDNPTHKTAAKAGRYDAPETLYEEFLSTINEKPCTATSTYDRKHVNEKGRNSNGSGSLFRKPHDLRPVTQRSKCYNCGGHDHISNKCPKPRLVCKRCNWLGHEEKDCKRTLRKRTYSVQSSANKSYQKNYLIDCLVNSTKVCGYIDTGSAAVLINESTASKLNLAVSTSNVVVSGFAGGSIAVTGECNVQLEVDLAYADVKALVVPDRVQQVDIIVGQPFINHPNVVMTIKDGIVRVFNKELADLPQIEHLPAKRVTIRVAESSVIPPHHLAHITVTTDCDPRDTVYVDLQNRTWAGHAHCIPSCIFTASPDAVLPLLNASNNELLLKPGEVLARGEICTEESLQAVNGDFMPSRGREGTQDGRM